MGGVALFGSNAPLLGYVRSLSHSRGPYYEMGHLPRDSGDYLSALHNLRSLKLRYIRVEHISGDEFRTCFSAFRESLTCLFLDNFATSFSLFVTLADYFPNMTTLELRPLILEPDGGPVPSLSRPLWGKLRVHGDGTDALVFLNRVSKLDMEYEELVLDASLFMYAETHFVESGLQISPSTVKCLRLTIENRECEYNLLALIKTACLPHLTCSSRTYADDPRLSSTQGVGTGGDFATFLPPSPPLFNHLHRTPEDHLCAVARTQMGEFQAANANGGLAFD